MTDSPDDQPTEALTRRSMREASGSSRRSANSKPAAQPKQPKQPEIDPETGEPIVKTGVTASIAAMIAKHPRVYLASALGVAFLLLATAAVFAGVAAGSNSSAAAPLPSASQAPPRPQPSAFPSASRLRTCSVNAYATDSRLSAFSGYVVNASTGETLFDRNGTVPQRTGSVLKVITAAAALNVLGAGATLTTQVFDGTTPGTIVLKGGGDPTLATGSSVYGGAPQIKTLADAAMAQYQALHPNDPITTIVLDSTMWDPADDWDSTWNRREQGDGYQAQVTALMVNGGRDDPSSTVSPRTTDPIGDAGRAFASAAGLTGVEFSRGAAASSTVLASVQSQPVSTLIGQMLMSSDNVLAENLARVVSKTMGFDGSSTSLAQAIPGALVEYGLPTQTLTIRDGSGLSDANAVSPQFMTTLFNKIRANEKNLGLIYSSLPISGQSGTLASRFTGDNEIARGAVVAKTGWLDTEYSLAGVVNASDGTALSFAFYSIADGISSSAKDAQDTLATALFTCGDNLSNN